MERSYCKQEHIFHTPKKKAEARVLFVLTLTLLFMLAEIVGGYLFNSVALLADGIHMSTHAIAFGITLGSYMLARKWSKDKTFSFGTWKVEVLGAYTSAVILGVMAFFVLGEAVIKLIKREEIRYDEALIVAFAGLLVNLLSAFILHEEEEHDHNLRSAYLHVLADTFTSLLAIASLLGGKYLGMWYLDPITGIVGFGVILSWSYGLIKDTASILLDREMHPPFVERLISRIEEDRESKVEDIHLLRIAHSKYACIISITTKANKSPDDYLKLIEDIEEIAHTTIEVRYCDVDNFTKL